MLRTDWDRVIVVHDGVRIDRIREVLQLRSFEVSEATGHRDVLNVPSINNRYFRTGQISKADQLLPWYVIENFKGSGLSGLFVAGVFSAALSTISPLLNSLAAVTVEDYIKVSIHMAV